MHAVDSQIKTIKQLLPLKTLLLFKSLIHEKGCKY